MASQNRTTYGPHSNLEIPATDAYQDLLALWQDADEDLPILADVRAEYAALD